MNLFEHAEAKSRADLGMTRAVERADAVTPSWSERAYYHLFAYSTLHPHPWMVEDLRQWAKGRGLPDPPDGRAWGAVIQRAARAGTIVRVGWQEAKSSNNSPKGLWSAA